jgi:outer membrane assembly lipoprotein YfiO
MDSLKSTERAEHLPLKIRSSRYSCASEVAAMVVQLVVILFSLAVLSGCSVWISDPEDILSEQGSFDDGVRSDADEAELNDDNINSASDDDEEEEEEEEEEEVLDSDSVEEAKEIKASDEEVKSDELPLKLVRLAKKLYQNGMYSISREPLGTIKDRYPMSGYANFAELKYADAYYFNREYNQAAKAYEGYMKSYPASVELPYVKIQSARAHILSARDSGRDREPWERGLAIYDELVSSYDSSEYGRLASEERLSAVDELKRYDREIIDFYRRQGNSLAVSARERAFQERWSSK